MPDLTTFKIRPERQEFFQLNMKLEHDLLGMVDTLITAWSAEGENPPTRQEVVRACIRLTFADWTVQREKKRREDTELLTMPLPAVDQGDEKHRAGTASKPADDCCLVCAGIPDGHHYRCLTCERPLEKCEEAFDLAGNHKASVIDPDGWERMMGEPSAIGVHAETKQTATAAKKSRRKKS